MGLETQCNCKINHRTCGVGLMLGLGNSGLIGNCPLPRCTCIYANMTAYLQLATGTPRLNVEHITIWGQLSLAFLSTKHFGASDVYQSSHVCIVFKSAATFSAFVL